MPQMAIWSMSFEIWITKATDTVSIKYTYVLVIVFFAATIVTRTRPSTTFCLS